MRPEDTLTRRSVRWRVSGRPSTVRTVAVIMTTALCLSGCASHRSMKEEESSMMQEIVTDSMFRKVRCVLTTMPEPVSVAKMDVAYDSLSALPSGAVFTAREGRATATLQKDGNRIVVYATCDSLERQVACYEEEIARLRMKDEQRSDSVRTAKEDRRPIVPVLAFVAGMFVMWILRRVFS